MYPASLALVEDDREFGEYLALFLKSHGIDVSWFANSDDLLCSLDPYDFEFYILDLMLPGVDGLSLLRLLRRRSDAGVLTVSGMQGPDVFEQVMGAGADMHLAKPASFEQILLAIGAIYRRSGKDNSAREVWRLDVRRKRLIAPDGAVIDLSPTDVSVLSCLCEAQGNTVERAVLAQHIGLSEHDDPNRLVATIYRLRRRIERATPGMVPLRTKSRVGYSFQASLLQV
jgi:two-component system, OmpR family, response regulator